MRAGCRRCSRWRVFSRALTRVEWKAGGARLVAKRRDDLGPRLETVLPEVLGVTIAKRVIGSQDQAGGGESLEEIAREKELQKTYETIWLPEDVKHAPDWYDDHDH